MIPYFNELLQEEREELTQAIRLLERQTYVLERKYDRKTGRYQYSGVYRTLERHMEFLREYLEISGISIYEDIQLGVIYIKGEAVLAEKLPKLATLYLLILKVIYDEQMTEASNSLAVHTTLGELSERLGVFGLTGRTAPTEIRRALSLLKKYQIIEPLDLMDDLDGNMRLILYPTINLILTGNDVRELLSELGEGEGQDRQLTRDTEEAADEEENETDGEENEEDREENETDGEENETDGEEDSR